MKKINSIYLKLFYIISLLPLLDMFTFKKPIFTFTGYLILLILFSLKRNVRLNIYSLLVIIFLMIAITSSIFASFSEYSNITLIYYVGALIFFTSMGIRFGYNLDEYFYILKKIIIVYAIIIIAIYITRMYMYDFNLSRVRGSVSIFGGNSAQLIFLFMLIIFKRMGSKDYPYFLLFTFIHAIIFISRGAIIITILWAIVDFVKAKPNILNIKRVFGFVVATILLIVGFAQTALYDFLIIRLVLWKNSIEGGASFLGDRFDILLFTIDYMRDNVYTIFLGIGPTLFRAIHPFGYSSTHNLFSDILIETGIFAFIVMLIIFGITMIKSKFRIYYFICITYAVFEGVNLFYIDKIFATGYVYFFIVIIYLDSTKRTTIKEKGELLNNI